MNSLKTWCLEFINSIRDYENMNLFESENSLKTPEIVGTDEEKVAVLAYWSDLVGLLRSINTTVISIENKIAILDHLKNEVELVMLDVTNATAHAAVDKETGETSMKQDGDPEVDGPKEVDLSTPQDGIVNPPPSVAEQMRALAGIRGPAKQKVSFKTNFKLPEEVNLNSSQLAVLAGIRK